MEPALHQWYSVDDAVAAFEASTEPKFMCDRQYAVLPKAILCLFTVGDAASEPHVSTPSTVVWKPRRLNYVILDSHPWLPHAVREVRDQTQKPTKKIKEHHVLLRTSADATQYFYAGPAHLGSYGGPQTGGTPADYSAEFFLNQKLPSDAWLHLGGYRGWQVEVNHRTHRVASGDLQAFQALTDELPRQEFSHFCMTRYEEDSLTIHTNDRRGWLMYLREPADGGICTHDATYAGDPQKEESFRCVCGISLEFPARETLPRDLAIRAAEEFFVTGSLPKCVRWADE